MEEAVFAGIAVVVGHADRFVEVKDKASDQGVPVEVDTEAVAVTKLVLEGVVVALDDIHWAYRCHLAPHSVETLLVVVVAGVVVVAYHRACHHAFRLTLFVVC